MSEQEMHQVIDALRRYFDRARPDDDAHNAAISRADRERYGGQMLLLSPAVIVEGLRNLVIRQTLAFHDDAAANRELIAAGLYLLWCYRSLVKSYGMGGVPTLTMALPLSSVEDTVALFACTLASLSEETDPMIRIPLESAPIMLKPEFNRRYGTGCKIALAYALLRLGQQEPFRSFALPYIATNAAERKNLEKLVSSHRSEDRRTLEFNVMGGIILDIASNGRAMPPELGWKRQQE